MSSRRYRLLCPISRALDRVGDRWSLLILRDLHAGPARFTDLQDGLPGIATNLLTERLRSLEADGLIDHKQTDHGVSVYELTDLGRRTDGLLFELARFGAEFEPDDELKEPGTARSIAVTLQAALARVVDPASSIVAEMRVDGQPFTVTVDGGLVDVSAGSAADPDAVVETSYEPLIDVADGRMVFEEFSRNHRRVVAGEPEVVMALGDTMKRALAVISE